MTRAFRFPARLYTLTGGRLLNSLPNSIVPRRKKEVCPTFYISKSFFGSKSAVEDLILDDVPYMLFFLAPNLSLYCLAFSSSRGIYFHCPSTTRRCVPVTLIVPCLRLSSANLVPLAFFLSNYHLHHLAFRLAIIIIIIILSHHGCLIWSAHRRQSAATSAG